MMQIKGFVDQPLLLIETGLYPILAIKFFSKIVAPFNKGIIIQEDLNNSLSQMVFPLGKWWKTL